MCLGDAELHIPLEINARPTSMWPLVPHDKQGKVPVIDTDGYRANVGIIVCNHAGQVLWARRIGQNAWQFPQGGINGDESPRQALYRELWEEVGLDPQHVQILGWTSDWLRYRLPQSLMRYNEKPLCIGQKQIWYLLRLTASERVVRLDLGDKPEFDAWCWVDYWYPLQEVVSFKRSVYTQALQQLMPYLPARSPLQVRESAC